MAAVALPDLTARIRLDDSDLDKVGGKADKAGGRLKAGLAIGAGAAVAAGAGLVSFGKSAVDAFAAVEDATGAAGVQFGKSLPQVVKFAEQAFESFGLSKRAALDAQNTFGTLGKSAGLAGPELAGFAGKLTGLAGDLASFKGTSTEQAIEAVGAALRGESEPIRAYGVLLDDASLRQEALAQGLIKTTKEALTPQQKVLATQALILKQTSDAQGDFARTSDSTANTQKRLQAASENASAQLGQKLAPAYTAVRLKGIELIDNLTDTEGAFQRKVVPAVQKAADGIRALTGFVSNNQTSLAALAVGIGAVVAVTQVYSAVLAVQAAGGLLAFLNGTKLVTAATKAYTAVQAALNVVLSLNPIGIVVLALAALTAGVILAYNKSETFRDVVKTALEAVKTAFTSLATGALGVIDKLLAGYQAMATAAGKLPGPLGAPFRAAADAIGVARAGVQALTTKINEVPKSKTAQVAANVKGTDDVQSMRRAIDSVKSKTVFLTTVLKTENQRDATKARNAAVPGRASGGPVFAGRSYLVGEREPELFVPRVSGRILNQRQIASATAGPADSPDLTELVAEVRQMRASNERLEREFARQNDRYLTLARSGAI